MKRFALPAATVLGLLLTGVVLAQSGGSYGLGWSSVDGGGMFSTGGSYALGGSVGQADAGGPLSGGAYAVIGGFWPGALAAPQAITDLRGAKESGLLRLDWTAVTADINGVSLAGATYNVYRAADQPYFTPGAAYAVGISGAPYSDPDAAVLTDVAHSHYYLARAVHGALTSADSNRVGVFAFGLTPGSP